MRLNSTGMTGPAAAGSDVGVPRLVLASSLPDRRGSDVEWVKPHAPDRCMARGDTRRTRLYVDAAGRLLVPTRL